jgi:hypothetical protein
LPILAQNLGITIDIQFSSMIKPRSAQGEGNLADEDAGINRQMGFRCNNFVTFFTPNDEMSWKKNLPN